MFVYLDNSSTTKPYPQVIETMTRVLSEDFGNPSSLHTLGFTAEQYVKTARKAIADALGANSGEIYFTSGGTEADNTAIFGAAQLRRRECKKIITTGVEHPAVLEAARRLEAMGWQVEYIGVDRKCRLDMDALEAAMTSDTALISVMSVNNETGTIMPIDEIAKAKERFNKENGAHILLHTDAVQAFGKIPVTTAGVDMISVSGHKVHGPKGIGALYVKKGLNLPPFIVGGGQEMNMRSGTENMPGIAGFGRAVQIFSENTRERAAAMSAARKRLLQDLMSGAKDISINSPDGDDACPSVLNISFLGVRGEVLLHTLEQDGIFVSTGSACSSNKKGRSHVLRAMGLSDKEIEGAVRFSFSEFNTVEEMDYVAEKTIQAAERFRRLGRR